MNQTTVFLKHHSLTIGILLMFALTWPIDLANSGVLPIKFPFMVYLFLGWGFGVASVIMTGLTLGKDAVITLLKRFLIWRVGWKWYLAPFLLAPALIVGGVYLNAALTGVPPDFSTVMAYKIFGKSAYLPFFILPFFMVDFIANGEEIGWRGFLVPQLFQRYRFVATALISGLIWALWHFPLLLTSDYIRGGMGIYSLVMFTLLVLSICFPLTWLRLKSSSLWPAVLLHTSHNVFVLHVFDVLTSPSPLSPYFISETGAGLALITLLLAVFFWQVEKRSSIKRVV